MARRLDWPRPVASVNALKPISPHVFATRAVRTCRISGRAPGVEASASDPHLGNYHYRSAHHTFRNCDEVTKLRRYAHELVPVVAPYTVGSGT